MAADPFDLGGRVRRAATPARLLAKGASAAGIARMRALRGDRAEEIAADPKLVAAAEDIARTLGEMKGAAMKIGQALSFVDVSLIPKEYRTALQLLQADAPAMPFDAVRSVVAHELGGPVEELFGWFSPEPIAAASIGQVHMAYLGEREVVVKVQYPGVAKAVEADLRNAALLSGVARLGQRMLAGLVGDVDVRALVDEVRDRVGDELDYRIEAANQQEFADLYRDDPEIDIPEVVPERSTRRVLTTEYVDAMRWSAALAQPQELRDRWGQVLARFSYTSIFRHGVVNVDAHPGNYLFHEDGRVSFLDFGCVSRLPADQVERSRALLRAILAGTDEEILDALVDLGLLRSAVGFDPETLVTQYRRNYAAARAPQPHHYTKDDVEQFIAESMKLRIGANELRMLQRMDVPKEQVLLPRASLGLDAVLAHLESTVDFEPVLREVFGDDGPRVQRG